MRTGDLQHNATAGWIVLGLAFLLAIAQPATAQRRAMGGGAGVYKSRIAPHWFEGGLWYQNNLAGGTREFVLVDLEKGARAAAFDHARLAQALKTAGIENAPADRLPLDDLQFNLAEKTVLFRAAGKDWRCNLANYELSEIKDRPAAGDDDQAQSLRRGGPRASSRTGEETELTFINRTPGAIELFWLNAEGRRQSYGKLAAGGRKAQHTFAGHVWEIVAAGERSLGTYEADEAPSTVEIDGRALAARSEGSPRERRGPRAERSDRSPDGKWIAAVEQHNVVVRPIEGEERFELTTDGREGHAYGMLEWSPDSQTLVAWRIEPGDDHQVHLIESSPRDGGRARLHSREYPLPGDKFTSYELRLFHIAEKRQIPCSAELIDFGRPQLRWGDDGKTFTYQKIDRGHQRLRLIETEARTGQQRNLIDEQTDTFIWTAHQEGFDGPLIRWLGQTDEVIYASERDGWRHLYLVDAKEGAIRNPITQGEFVVRGIERIDEAARQIWFTACGREAGQDPYFLHHYRIGFDGTGLVALTAGDGTHTVQYSPDRQFLIDTWSRVDRPPVHVLRRTSDGSEVCPLEAADIAELQATGWQPPEVFSAKGRDGKTDIWGIVCRPQNFDPDKKYPVIEQIYAGPQGSFVPKSFSSRGRFSSLTDLGFVVVQIDGMGTANRSKAFHDVCWQNLKDAGLPDRILWHQAFAANHPWYDIRRVGIYGGSAGGQNSTGAVLFHPEFYKAAVSGCGCHDNRLDKASWNEQWMGYPVGPHYAECSNIENAHRLRGKLMLIVGEMDTNVPTESTFRLADALIRAGKDFDLVVVPGAGHGMGGAYGARRMHDFFVRHLQGIEPPDRNAP